MPTHIQVFRVLCSPQKIAPFGAADVTATAGVGAWVAGAVSANFLTTTVPIIIVGIEADPGNDHYDIEIVNAAGTVVYCTDHCKGNAAVTPTISLRASSELISTGTQVAARVSSAGGGAAIGLKLKYVEVP